MQEMHKIFWLEDLKRTLGRSRHRWEDNIIMNLREIRWEGVDWMHLLRIMTVDGLLWTRWWTFGFHKRRRIFRL